MYKMFLQVRDMLQEQGRMSEADVIEQYQVLMQLSHISHMWYDRDTVLAA